MVKTGFGLSVGVVMMVAPLAFPDWFDEWALAIFFSGLIASFVIAVVGLRNRKAAMEDKRSRITNNVSNGRHPFIFVAGSAKGMDVLKNKTSGPLIQIDGDAEDIVLDGNEQVPQPGTDKT